MPTFDRGPSTRLLTGDHVSRRDFLKLAGLSGAAFAVAGMPRPVGAQEDTSDAAVAPDDSVDSVQRLARQLNDDPEAIFRFVSEGVRYEPYAGLLRGPWTTLAGRAGNSVDQAALLTLLLRHAGFETRYAWAPIDPAVADEMAATGVVDAETVRAQAMEAFHGELPDHAPAAVPELSAEQSAQLEAATERTAEVTDWVRAELANSLEAIEAGLAEAGASPESGLATVPQLELDQHVWVQALLDGSDWVDLDPTHPTPAMGSQLAAAVETAPSLPEALTHLLEFAILVETAGSSGLEVSEMVRVSSPVWQVSREPIIVFNAGPEAVPNLNRAFAAAAGVRQYVPVLSIGDDGFSGTPMLFPEGEGGGFFSPAAIDGEAAAEWFELRITPPDADATVVRRAIFDRVDPADRTAGTVTQDRLTPVNLVPLGADGAEEIDVVMPLWWMSVAGGMPDLADHVPSDDSNANLALFAMTHHLATEFAGVSVASQFGARAFADGPNVTAVRIIPSADGTPDPTAGFGIDILHRSRGVVPVDGETATATAAAIPGVVSHLTERLMLGEHLSDEGLASGLVSVGKVFEAAAATEIPIRAYATPEQVDGAGYPAAAAALLRESVESGLIAFAPEATVDIGGAQRIGWWLIDTATGRVTDQMDDGRGSSEYNVTWHISVNQVYALRAAQEAARIQCIWGLAFAMLSAVVFIGGLGAAVLSDGTPEQILSMAIAALGAAGVMAGLSLC